MQTLKPGKLRRELRSIIRRSSNPYSVERYYMRRRDGRHTVLIPYAVYQPLTDVAGQSDGALHRHSV